MNGLETYAETVARLAREKKGEPVYNNSPAHAAIIMQQLMKSATKNLSLISYSLNPLVFCTTDVLEAFKALLAKKDVTVNILLESPEHLDLNENEFFKMASKSDKVEIKVLPDFISNDMEYHFTLADEDAYRYEPNKDKWEAVGAFGEAKGGSNLRSIFDSVWEDSDAFQSPVIA